MVAGSGASSVTTRSVHVIHTPFNLGCIHFQLAFHGEDHIFPFGSGRNFSDGGSNGALAELVAASSATKAIRGELTLSEVPWGELAQLPYSQDARPRQAVRDGHGVAVVGRAVYVGREKDDHLARNLENAALNGSPFNLENWPVVLLEPGKNASAPLQDRLRQLPGSFGGAHKVPAEEATVLVHQCPVDLRTGILP